MDKKVHAFPNYISPKWNVTAWLDFEIEYDDITAH